MLSVQTIQRASGRSVVAAAAYRAGENLTDERLAMSFDFTGKDGIAHSEIMAPAGTPGTLTGREGLWNAAEMADKRIDSVPAREVLIALPHELDAEQRRDLVQAFTRETLVSRGMIADVSIHEPGKEGDQRNHHAHILLTTRDVGEGGFGKKNADWHSREFVSQIRTEWAAIQNRHLAQNLGEDAPKVSEKSLAARGIEQEAGVKKGPAVVAMERRGLVTEMGGQDDGVRVRNGERDRKDKTLDAEMAAGKRTLRPTLEVAAEVEGVRAQMAGERETWRRARDGIDRPEVLSKRAVEGDLTKPEAARHRKAKAAQVRIEQGVQAKGIGLRRIRNWARDPLKAAMRAIFRKNAELSRVLAAQRETEVAARALASKRQWVGSEAGQAHVANLRQPGLDARAKAARDRRVIDRKIKRIDVRIAAATRTVRDLKVAHELNKKTLVFPEKVAFDARRSSNEKRYIRAMAAPARAAILTFPKPSIAAALARVIAGKSIHMEPQNLPGPGVSR